MKSKKLLSLLLAVIMIMSAVPMFASAAELITPQITAIPTATEIANSGDRLRTSTLSGGVAIDPDTGVELEGVWSWTSTGTKITESGYYGAYFQAVEYEKYARVTFNVYVRIAGDTSDVNFETIIDEAPIITNTIMYGDDWSELEFTGGKAVNANGEEIAGLFTHSLSGTVSSAGTRSIEFLFTPTDENYATATVKVNYTVAPMPISFGSDFNGTSIDDPFEYEAKPGALMRDVLNDVKKHLNYPTPSVVGIEDANSYAENGRVYKITVLNYDSTNYTGSEAYVKTVFKDVEFAASSASYYTGTEEIHVTFNSNKAPGAFDVYLDGKLIGDDVKLANDYIDVPYKLETSGKHTVKVVYNPIENDYYFMADYETEIQANVRRYITLKDMSGSQYINVNGKETLPSTAYILYGDEISIKYGFEDLFASWVITDTAGKAVDLGVDLTSSEISFAMPDHDLVISVKTTLDEEEPDDGNDDGTDDGIFGSICSFLQKIISWFISIIKQMMSLLGLGS